MDGFPTPIHSQERIEPPLVEAVIEFERKKSSNLFLRVLAKDRDDCCDGWSAGMVEFGRLFSRLA